MSAELKEMQASTMSNVDIKFESNSKGTNVTSHVYSNATDKEIDDCFKKAVALHRRALKEQF